MLYCGTKAKGLPGLARGGAVGTPPEITQPYGAAGPAVLVEVEGCRVMEMPPTRRWCGRGGDAEQLPAQRLRASCRHHVPSPEDAAALTDQTSPKRSIPPKKRNEKQSQKRQLPPKDEEETLKSKKSL